MRLADAAAAWSHHLGDCPGSESSSFSCTKLGCKSRRPWDVSPLKGPRRVSGSCHQLTSISQLVKVKGTKGFSENPDFDLPPRTQ